MLPRFLTICSSSHARSVLSVSWIGANLKGRVEVALTLRRQLDCAISHAPAVATVAHEGIALRAAPGVGRLAVDRHPGRRRRARTRPTQLERLVRLSITRDEAAHRPIGVQGRLILGERPLARHRDEIGRALRRSVQPGRESACASAGRRSAATDQNAAADGAQCARSDSRDGARRAAAGERAHCRSSQSKTPRAKATWRDKLRSMRT